MGHTASSLSLKFSESIVIVPGADRHHDNRSDRDNVSQNTSLRDPSEFDKELGICFLVILVRERHVLDDRQ